MPMLAVELDGIEIDHCVKCLGTWLDEGELEAIARQSGAPADGILRMLQRAQPGSATDRRCPRCKKRMRETETGDSNTITLDQCPRGHGLWFDQGELREIIASTDDGTAGPVGRFFAELYRSELAASQTDSKGD